MKAVIIDDEKLIIERAAVPDYELHNYACGHLQLYNDNNAVIANNSKEASMRLVTNGDKSFMFFSAFNVEGTDVFLLKKPSGDSIEIEIVIKKGQLNQYIFKYADLDGSNEVLDTIKINDYSNVDLIYYSFTGGVVENREPAKGTWDVLFTQYVTKIPAGPVFLDYPVTGVQSASGVSVAEVRASDLDRSAYVMTGDEIYSDGLTVIGSDWKEYNPGTHAYAIVDTVLYVVKNAENEAYPIYFTATEGSATGVIKWAEPLEPVTSLSMSENSNITVYPNPANKLITIKTDKIGLGVIRIYNDKGMNVFQEKYVLVNETTIDISALKEGMYILQVDNGQESLSVKLVIRR